ncbi:hypothetical protein PRNP1_013801 [Phytophthora ramorum]
MLQRVLAREKVDERQRALFRASGIITQRHLLQRPLWDVAHAVDLSVRETEVWLPRIDRKTFDLTGTSMSFGLRPLSGKCQSPDVPADRTDEHRPGSEWGTPLSSPVEFVGTAGIGKSQVAMTLAVMCAMDYPDNSVMFFDVELNFSAKRLLQITVCLDFKLAR